jgi:putative Holliday junction resolvase
MLEISIPSSIEYLALVDAVCEAFCSWANVPRQVADDISMAAIEAATNAIVHGNGSDPSKKAKIVFERTDCDVTITVADLGSGFDPDAVPCPVDEDRLLAPAGRGIFIMKSVMDEVQITFPKGGGTRVRLVKRVESEACGRVLCIDYGEKRMGLAMSDELRITAQPVGFIEVGGKKSGIEDVIALIAEHNITEIVLGMPFTMSGGIGQAASQVLHFARELRHRTGLSVATCDERLSTVEGERVLIEGGVRRKERKNKIDSVAAAIVLQSYLDARRNK